MGLLKRLLLTFSVFGLAATTLAGGTLASFSAQSQNAATFTGGTVTMTNVAGTVVSGTNCSSATYSGTCATIFNVSNMKPGAADSANTVAITYDGTFSTTDFRLYATGYSSKTASSNALCTATNPASKLNVQVKKGATIIYPTSGTGYGTLDGFATTYTSTANGLQLSGSGGAGIWATNDTATYTINVNLDSTADNTYQGCQSTATLSWYATP